LAQRKQYNFNPPKFFCLKKGILSKLNNNSYFKSTIEFLKFKTKIPPLQKLLSKIIPKYVDAPVCLQQNSKKGKKNDKTHFSQIQNSKREKNPSETHMETAIGKGREIDCAKSCCCIRFCGLTCSCWFGGATACGLGCGCA
jgi:hypothetical protein